LLTGNLYGPVGELARLAEQIGENVVVPDGDL
jgi:hypothetical protein